jgi:hypothetical protein
MSKECKSPIIEPSSVWKARLPLTTSYHLCMWQEPPVLQNHPTLKEALSCPCGICGWQSDTRTGLPLSTYTVRSTLIIASLMLQTHISIIYQQLYIILATDSVIQIRPPPQLISLSKGQFSVHYFVSHWHNTQNFKQTTEWKNELIKKVDQVETYCY